LNRATVEQEIGVAKAQSGRETSASKRPKASKRKGSGADVGVGVADSIAVFVGATVGKAVKQTRSLRAQLSAVGSGIVDASSRVGERVKDYLPAVVSDVVSDVPSRAKNTSSPRRKRVSASKRALPPVDVRKKAAALTPNAPQGKGRSAVAASGRTRKGATVGVRNGGSKDAAPRARRRA
jgi:hypothetical protein